VKIIVVENSYRGGVGSEPSIISYPDSCIFRNNEAFYLPEIHTKVTMTAGFIVKIGKIGKNIQSCFADRYFSEIGLALNFINKDLESECLSKNINPAPAWYFDRSLSISNTFENYEITKRKTFEAHITIGDTELTFTLQSLRFTLQDILTTVSKYIMIKIGDLLYVPFINLDKGVNLNDTIDGFLLEKHIIRCQIK